MPYETSSFRITSPDSLSVAITSIIPSTNSKSEIAFVNYEDAYSVGFEDMARRVPNISKIKQFTGWEPEIDLKTIIGDVANDV